MRILIAAMAAALMVFATAEPADAQGRFQRPGQPRARLQIHAPGTGGFRGRMAVPPGLPQRGQGVGVGQGMGLFSPQVLVRQREFLELTDDQVARLEQLDEEARQVRDETAEQIQEHREALQEAMAADVPDVDAVRTHAQAVHDAQQAVQLAHLTVVASAKGLLTEEQRSKLDEWTAGARRGAAGAWGRRVPQRGFRMPGRIR